jgi:hypothetical protein
VFFLTLQLWKTLFKDAAKSGIYSPYINKIIMPHQTAVQQTQIILSEIYISNTGKEQ